MNSFSGFGSRIAQERKRMNHSQEAFASFAGVTKLTQRNYEKEARKPDIAYLQAIEEAGADSHYIVTGCRIQSSDTRSESTKEHWAEAYEWVFKIAERLNAMQYLTADIVTSLAEEIYTVLVESEDVSADNVLDFAEALRKKVDAA